MQKTHIATYDFYNPQNILIVDRVNPHIDPEFLTLPYVNVSESIIFKRYSLTNWIQTMLDNKNKPENPMREM